MIESLKRSKAPFLVLILLLCIPLFALSAGASENLVPTDMREWQAQSIGSATITYYAGSQGNELTFTPQSGTYIAAYMSGVNYVAGHTYQLTFGSSYNEVSEVEWGFAYPVSNGIFDFITSSTSITSTNSMSFVAPNTINSVYVVFWFNGNRRENIQINHLLCVDVTASEQQAVIDNANENTNKIGGWFSELGDNIRSWFTELSNKIREIFVVEDYIYPSWVSRSVVLATGDVGGYRSSDAVTSDFIEPLYDMTVTNDGVLDGELSDGLNLLIYNLDGSYVGYRNFTVSETLTTEYKYRIHLRDSTLFPYYLASDDNENLSAYMNEHLVIKSEVTVFEKLAANIINGIRSMLDRLSNLILYFNADGDYTNPFTFGDIEGVSEYVIHIQGAFDGFNDGINDFVAPIGVVNAVLDEVVGEWGFIAVAVTFVLSALVLIRFLGV